MLVTLKEILAMGEEKKIAIGAFNTPNMPTLLAVMRAAEETGLPVIIMHAQVHEEMGLCKMEQITPVMKMFAENAKVPVSLHLDHGTDLDYIRRGLELGFTSVMYDGSALSEEENTKNTKIAVEMAAKYGASVEAEIGSMGARDGSDFGNSDIYTKPADAAKFVKETGIDALACAFGTAHGFYKAAPKLDFDRIAEIRASINEMPIVMHGGSGVSDDGYRECVRRGVRKINYYTYMANAGGKAISNKNYALFHEALADAEEAIKENVKHAMLVFANR